LYRFIEVFTAAAESMAMSMIHRFTLAALIAVTGFGFALSSQAVQPNGTLTLKAYVNYADLVPQALFGSWLRTRHIEKSNAREMIDRVEEGAWVIYRDGDRVMLQNPDNGVETQVEVDKVSDGTAVFHFKRQLAQGRWCQEQLNLTADEDGTRLRGFQIKECYQPVKSEAQGAAASADAYESYYYAFARVQGRRNESLKPVQ
jgi:hypothetical protein